MSSVLAIFPDRSPMWDHAATRLRERLGDRVGFAHDLKDGGGAAGSAEIILSFALSGPAAAAATRLRWLQALGAGVDGIHLPPGGEVILTNARGLHAAPVSEAALAAMLWHVRRMGHAVALQREARWEPWAPALLRGATLGILGTGAIACSLAQKAKAFEMRVLGFSSSPRPLAGFDEVLARAALAARAPTLDHLVLLAPLDATTRRLVDAGVIAALRPGALLVNVGRGALVDEEALVTALEQGRIAAALDTVAHEPLAAESPLWRLPNVLVTPHVAGRHRGYVDDVLDLFFANLAAFEAGDVAAMRNRLPASG